MRCCWIPQKVRVTALNVWNLLTLSDTDGGWGVGTFCYPLHKLYRNKFFVGWWPIPLLNLSFRWWFPWQQTLFFQLICICTAGSCTETFSGLLLGKHELNLFIYGTALFGNLHFLLKLIRFIFLTTIYSFVCEFSFHYCWYCYNQKHSSCGDLRKSFS